MPVTRSEAVAYLADTQGDLIVALGLTAADTSGNLKGPIDEALRLLGVARADRAAYEVADDLGDAYEAVLAVTTLERLALSLAALPDFSADGASYKWERDAIAARLAAAKANPLVWTYLPSVWRAGSLSVGWVEPDEDVA